MYTRVVGNNSIHIFRNFRAIKFLHISFTNPINTFFLIDVDESIISSIFASERAIQKIIIYETGFEAMIEDNLLDSSYKFNSI